MNYNVDKTDSQTFQWALFNVNNPPVRNTYETCAGGPPASDFDGSFTSFAKKC